MILRVNLGLDPPPEVEETPEDNEQKKAKERQGDEDLPSLNISAREIRALSAPATTLHVPGKDARVGDLVKARYLASKHGAAGTMWYQGKVVAENADDDTVAVRFDDGDFEEHVHRMYVRPM